MNKSDLVAEMAASADISKAAADRALQGLLEAVTNSLSNGEPVALIGFGSFSVVKRAARDGRNPSTGKKMKIKAKTVAKFKVGSRLADSVK
jgi:DNA-binding protein HU-beta